MLYGIFFEISNFMKNKLIILCVFVGSCALAFTSLAQEGDQGFQTTSSRDIRNWGVVEAGQVFRSGQPVKDQLLEASKTHGIKSVLILHNSMREDVTHELELAEQNQIQALHLPISDHEMLSDENLFKIIAFLKEAPKPVLIHCRAGADRTGLVSAIYRNLFMNQDLAKAKSEMLTLKWGHLSFGGTKAMDNYLLNEYPTKVEALRKEFNIP